MTTEQNIADALRVVALRLEEAIERRKRSNRIDANDLRCWALAQFACPDDLATRTTVELQDRQLVEAFVQRIEINPETKTGEIILIADLADAFREGPSRELIRDWSASDGGHSSMRVAISMTRKPVFGSSFL